MRVWELAKRAVQEFIDDDCMHMVAGIAYYAFFSLFPLLLGLIAVLGLILEPSEVQQRVVGMASQAFPSSAEVVAHSIEAAVASRSTLGVLSAVGLFWSASAIFAAARRSLNRAWDVERERPLLAQKMIELGMLGGVGLLSTTASLGTSTALGCSRVVIFTSADIPGRSIPSGQGRRLRFRLTGEPESH